MNMLYCTLQVNINLKTNQFGNTSWMIVIIMYKHKTLYCRTVLIGSLNILRISKYLE